MLNIKHNSNNKDGDTTSNGNTRGSTRNGNSPKP